MTFEEEAQFKMTNKKPKIRDTHTCTIAENSEGALKITLNIKFDTYVDEIIVHLVPSEN